MALSNYTGYRITESINDVKSLLGVASGPVCKTNKLGDAYERPGLALQSYRILFDGLNGAIWYDSLAAFQNGCNADFLPINWNLLAI